MNKKILLLFLLLFACVSISAVSAVNSDNVDNISPAPFVDGDQYDTSLYDNPDTSNPHFLTFYQWLARYTDHNSENYDLFDNIDYEQYCTMFDFEPAYRNY